MRAARHVVPLLLLLCSAGCHADRDEVLARRGEIDPDAPLRIHLHIAIAAPPARVWAVLSDIRHWPDWQPDIGTVRIDAPPSPGVRFAWTTTSGTIRSRIAAFEPGRRLSWTGRLLWIRAVHVWTLSPDASGGTIVSCDESLRGLGIGWLMNSTELADTDRRWLAVLERAAESGHGSDPRTG